MEWTFRQFYIASPHLISAVKDALIESNLKGIQIGQSLTDQLQSSDYKMNSIHQPTTDELKQASTPKKIGPQTFILAISPQKLERWVTIMPSALILLYLKNEKVRHIQDSRCNCPLAHSDSRLQSSRQPLDHRHLN